MSEQEKIARLIVLYLQGQISEEEKQELEVWRKASEKHEEIFTRCCSEGHWEESIRRFVKTGEIQERMRQKLKSRIAGNMRRIRLRRWGYAAAVVLILGVAGVLIYDGWNVREKTFVPKVVSVAEKVNVGKSVMLTLEDGSIVDLKDSTTLNLLAGRNGMDIEVGMLAYGKTESDSGEVVSHTLMVPRGGEYIVTLSDSTKVYLNADTRLTYPVRFLGGERKVVLEGEAYFDVAKNREMPFIVMVGDMRVEVTGTTFGIRAYKEEGEILTTLETGKVRVSEGNQMVNLYPDEQAVFNLQAKSMEKKKVDVNQYLAWKSGYMVFDNTPLERIMSDLDRWYGVHTVFRYPEMCSYRFSLNVKKHDSYMEILRLLEAAGDIHFEVEGDTIYVN